jgi:hypothetical protein
LLLCARSWHAWCQHASTELNCPCPCLPRFAY